MPPGNYRPAENSRTPRHLLPDFVERDRKRVVPSWRGHVRLQPEPISRARGYNNILFRSRRPVKPDIRTPTPLNEITIGAFRAGGVPSGNTRVGIRRIMIKKR